MKGRTILFLLLPLACAAAQHDPGNIVQHVRVHVVLPDENCNANRDVTLAAHNGPVFRGMRSEGCDVDFSNVPEGE